MNALISRALRPSAAAVLVALTVVIASGVNAKQDATPVPYSCDRLGMMATPMAGHSGTSQGAMASPGTEMPAIGTMPGGTMEFDQFYIDMMIPHHAAIIALAHAATPRLTDERLRTIAGDIITVQTAEIEELRGYRERFYGEAGPAPIDAGMMEMMMGGGSGSMPMMDEMMRQMDPMAQTSAFCAAGDADLTFIDLVMAHHDAAIVVSEMALTAAVNPEIKAFAQRVIDVQRQENETLAAIRAELTGSATPAA